jgi:hypothetical protein
MSSAARSAAVAVTAALLCAGVAAPAAPAAATQSCASHSGRIFHRGAISVFVHKRGKRWQYSLCSARLKSPRVFHQRPYESDGDLPDTQTPVVLDLQTGELKKDGAMVPSPPRRRAEAVR